MVLIPHILFDWLKALNSVCAEQIFNADQSLMEEEALGMIYQGKRGNNLQEQVDLVECSLLSRNTVLLHGLFH